MSISSGLVVQGDREHERACLRIIEIVYAARPGPGRNRPTEVGLRVVAGVVRPRLEVAPRDPDVDAREPERTLYPRRVQGVAHRQLAQLDEATVLDARLVDPDERARDHVAVVVLADMHGRVCSRPHDRSIELASLTEYRRVASARGRVVAVGARAARLGVLVSAVAPERTLRAV